MLSVTFSQPIVIDAANLHSLLSLANAPALVEPCKVFEVAAQKPGRKPRLTNADPNAPTADPVPEADKPKRTRRTKAEMEQLRNGGTPEQASDAGPETEAAVTTEAEAVAEAPASDAPKKAGRKPKAEKVADAEKSTSTGAGATPDAAAMLERFAKLIDADFGKAKSALDEFGVNRFSDLKPDQLGAFDAKLTELGV